MIVSFLFGKTKEIPDELSALVEFKNIKFKTFFYNNYFYRISYPSRNTDRISAWRLSNFDRNKQRIGISAQYEDVSIDRDAIERIISSQENDIKIVEAIACTVKKDQYYLEFIKSPDDQDMLVVAYALTNTRVEGDMILKYALQELNEMIILIKVSFDIFNKKM